MQQARHTLFETACSDLDVLLDQHPLPELAGIRLFATGCTGFFGYWLLAALECLNRQGQPIEVVALSRDPQVFVDRHPEFRGRPWLSFVQGDVANFQMPGGQFEAVIHGATDSSPRAAANPAALLSSMIDGTRRVLDVLADAGCRRFLLLSSGAVYGDQPASISALKEDDGLAGDSLNPSNAYGEGKRIMEMLCACRADKDVPAAVVARCFAFLGPHLPSHLAPAQFLRDALACGPIVLRGDGSPLRSYLYAADLALWLLTLLARGNPGRAYNIGGAEAISLTELARVIRDTVAPGARIDILGSDSGAPRQRYLPDTRRAREDLGLEAWTPLPQAIIRMAEAIYPTSP
ncbi:MAG: NAD(P)-dependent oxidoreductase [Sulfuritalea sp.]|jgi:dTDP-glucose 4,6-dehydratase|nr:NAD(P)-dependent oxidoreductase [Sulfuritalea sp.]